jgi:hypothetical protein
MYEYKCRLVQIIIAGHPEDVVLDLDLGFDITYRAKIHLTNVYTPEPRGSSRTLGLHAKEYIASWFEENDNGRTWPFIVRIDREDVNGPWLGEISPEGKPESLNERLLLMGFGTN